MAVLSLKEFRERLGITQAELARRSGLRQATISALENGRSRPHSSTVLVLATALETSESEIRTSLAQSHRDHRGSDGQIEQMVGDWAFLSGLDADLRSGLARSLVAAWTHSSTALEGNTITAGDTLFVLTEGLTVSGKSLREHQELHGHAQALGQMLVWIRSRRPLQIEHLHELHRAVQTGTVIDSLAPVGHWKVEPNGTMVITSKGTTEWHDYGQPRHVPALIDAWLKMLTQSCRQPILKLKDDDAKMTSRPQVYAVAVDFYTDLHLGFVGIHPYADGNGRMARLLANIPVLRAGLPPLLVDAARRRDYLALLGDYTLARGAVSPGEELVVAGSERDALHAFFTDQWKETLQQVRDFHQRQTKRMI